MRVALIGSLLCLLAFGALADNPTLPMSRGAGAGITSASGDGRYLRLDASNDPLTGQLALNAAGSIASPALVIPSALSTGPYLVSATPATWGWSFGGVEAARMRGTDWASVTTGSWHLNTANGVAATPTFSFAGDTDGGLFRPSADNVSIAAGGAEIARFNATGISDQATTGSYQIQRGAGSATVPTYSFAGNATLGMYRSAANTIMFTVNGANELSLNATVLGPAAAGGLSLGTTGAPFSTANLQGGTAAAPALTVGATNTGVFGGASTLSLSVAGVEQAFVGSTGTLFLPASGGGMFTSTLAADGNQNYIGIGQVFAEFGNGAATSASFGMRSGVVEAAPVDGVRYYEATVSCTGSACTTSGTRVFAVVSDDANGSTTEGSMVNTTALNLGAISGHVGVTPTNLPGCTSALRGQMRYKEDTDTAGTAPALCFCSRDNAALTYSWKLISGAGTCP